MEHTFRLVGQRSAVPPLPRPNTTSNVGCARTPFGRIVSIREQRHGQRNGPQRMRLQGSTVAFGRHESFPLRFGWITKGLGALKEDSTVFSKEDATVILGVGKNMVAAIRHWLLAARLAEPSDRNALAATPIADIAFGDGGDPYLEDDGTIWLLHWLLATNPASATAIYWFFNHFHKPTFSSVEVATALSDFVKQEVSARTAATTLKRDAQLVLRMYARTSGGTRLTMEDALDSPLAMLDLQERLDGRNWRAVPMDRVELPLSIFAFAVAELFEHTDAPQLAIQDLMYSDNAHCAPGAVFRMTEEGLVGKLEALCDAFPGVLRLSRTAGVFQLHKLESLNAISLLEAHYCQEPQPAETRARAVA